MVSKLDFTKIITFISLKIVDNFNFSKMNLVTEK